MKKFFFLGFIFCSMTSIAQELPFDVQAYHPMPLPTNDNTVISPHTEIKAIHYNMLNQNTDTFNIPYKENNGILDVKKKGFIPTQQITDSSSSIIQPYIFTNISPADQISGFPNYPFSAIVKLYLQFSDGSQSTCSGAMIGPRHAITAGHCVANPQSGAQLISSTNSFVVPAYNMGSVPFSYASITGWWSFNGWVQNSDYNYDIAIVELDWNIGNNVGWLGYGYNTDNLWFQNNSNDFKSIGYPAQDDFGNQVFEGGERLYAMNGYFDWSESYNSICHNNIGYHGQSGSGLYYKDANNDRYVYGVLSHGNGTNPPYYTCHTKMDQAVFDFFDGIIAPTVPTYELPEIGTLAIFPNPTTDKINLQLPKSYLNQRLSLQLIDAIGREVFYNTIEATELNITLETTHLPSGLYRLILKTNNVVCFQNVIKY